jgi:hypothetical protein
MALTLTNEDGDAAKTRGGSNSRKANANPYIHLTMSCTPTLTVYPTSPAVCLASASRHGGPEEAEGIGIAPQLWPPNTGVASTTESKCGLHFNRHECRQHAVPGPESYCLGVQYDGSFSKRFDETPTGYEEVGQCSGHRLQRSRGGEAAGKGNGQCRTAPTRTRTRSSSRRGTSGTSATINVVVGQLYAVKSTNTGTGYNTGGFLHATVSPANATATADFTATTGGRARPHSSSYEPDVGSCSFHPLAGCSSSVLPILRCPDLCLSLLPWLWEADLIRRRANCNRGANFLNGDEKVNQLPLCVP